jgi:bifunctional DNase/RNase
MAILTRALGGKVEEVVVDRLTDGFYCASVRVSQRDASSMVDLRPSDAFILAMIFQCPIAITNDLLHRIPS